MKKAKFCENGIYHRYKGNCNLTIGKIYDVIKMTPSTNGLTYITTLDDKKQIGEYCISDHFGNKVPEYRDWE